MRGNGNRHTRRRSIAAIALTAALVTALWVAATGSSALSGTTLPSSVTLQGWDTVSNSWTTGNTVRYAEGQAIPFRLNVSGLTQGTTYLATVCHEFVRSGVYGFTWLERYDSDVTPGTLGGTVGSDKGPFSGINVDLLDVEVAGAQGSCDSGERQVQVTFQVTGATAYLLWGGHLAAPLDPIPGGGTVGYQQSAGWNNGSSLAMRLDSPDKTVPIPPGKIIRLSKIDVTKVVQGGSAQPGDFCFTISPNPAGQSQVCGNGSFLALPTGSYTITESSGPAGYALQSVTGTRCALADLAARTATASVEANDGTPVTASCTFTNVQLPAPKLIVKKVVKNDNGGTKTVTDFSFSVNGGAAVAFEADGQNDLTLSAGTYTVTEPAVGGYAASYDGCSNVVLVNGDTKTCTITNDDQPGTLIVKKVVKNDNGGTKTAADFSFSVNGGAAVSFEADGQNDVTVNAGTYSVVETAAAGYTTTYDSCSNLVIPNGGTATCTITNDDQPGTLIVKKVVKNDNGGAKKAEDFSFSVNGGAAVSFEADGQNDLTVAAGTYSVVETAAAGYTTSYDNCSNLVIPNGGTATCTVTNDDVAATLIVKKVVVNDNGGAKTASDFSFRVNGGAAVAFETDGQNDLSIAAGTYSVTEPAVAGYTATYDGCSNVVLALGETKTCTITNDDQPATLIVKKVVVNDEGGTKTAADFSFSVNGAPAVAFEADGQNDLTVNAGTYTVTEPAVEGYEASYASCANLVIPNGGSATCTITNADDVAPTVELEKTVDPVSLPEPGGQFTFTLVVRNLSDEEVTITSLTDDVYGDLLASNPDSDCDELDGWTLSAKGAAENADEVTCSFTVVLSGKQAGFTETDTVTVRVLDDEGDAAEASDSATLEITDVPSSIALVKTASPTAMQAPGGPVTFSVVVQNTSATDAVTIDTLVDSIHGNLDGKGTCAVPQTIAAGGSYSCSFTVTVAATETDVVTATGTDDDGNELTASDDATVTVTPTPPPPTRSTPQVDVQVVKDATAQVTLGSNGTATIAYSVLVRNNGPNQANNVSLADAAPSGVTFGAITKQPDFGSCTIDPAVLSCNLGTMGLGVQTLITWTATVNVTGSIVNSATAAGSGGAETNPGNNTDTATTLVVAPAVTPTPKPKPPVLKPPTTKPAVVICKTLTVRQSVLQATGAKQRIRATVTEKLGKRSKPIAGARILITGPGLRLTVVTNKQGVAIATIVPKQAGIVRLSISNKKPCNTQRIGVVGVFEPPVTG